MLYYGHSNRDNINLQIDEIIWGEKNLPYIPKWYIANEILLCLTIYSNLYYIYRSSSIQKKNLNM